ncbi:restriction endonuclease subunit S [Pseudomonas syringae]|uniref:restriction endonuclease subunit S n=1 Tax=Pseudomonas syringae TaxID=317 RepID=UPI00041F6DA1|nr:restriction endonuclease subunit S [Pseudomonas syringae]
MSSKQELGDVMEDNKLILVPKLRFPEFRGARVWGSGIIGDYLKESRTPSLLNDPTKRITVRLHLQGVEHRAHRGTESTESANNFRRKAGQFIYGKQNIHKGAFGIVPTDLDGFETSQDLPCFDFRPTCYPLWFYYHLARENIYCSLELKMTGTGSKRLNEKTFLALSVSAPGYLEQQKIAECLSSADELIAAQGQKVDALKTHKKGLMQQIFLREGETQPRLRFPEYQNTGPWEIKTIGDIFETSAGGTPERSKMEYWNGSIPWVTTSLVDFNTINNSEEFITDEGLRNSSAKLFPKHTVLIALIGQGKTRGKAALLGIEASTNQNCAAILPTEVVIPSFTFLNLCSRYEEVRALSNTAGQGSLSQGLIRTLSFGFPKDKAEQQRIVSCLTRLDNLITVQTQKHEALKSHKKGLMQQLFPTQEMVE